MSETPTRGPAPGPWTTLPSVWEKADTCIMAADGLAVAHVIFPADVPMLAAAKEMFEALEAVLYALIGLHIATERRSETAEQAIQGGQAALARARGEQP